MVEETFDILSGLLVYGLKKNLFTIPKIKSWFDYESLIDVLED